VQAIHRRGASIAFVLLLGLAHGAVAEPAEPPVPATGGALKPPLGPPDLFKEMHWRGIGPYRGGRTKAATGVPGQPGVFYIGAVNGGVFRSNDYGRTWIPIFDGQPTGSIGAIAVAPSNPEVIYVGSGEGLHRPDLSTGDGLYKSVDGGRSFRHLGLRDAQQIPQIIVDPRDPDRLFVAVLGHPYGPSEERGIFRSLDGGETFQKVLYQGPDTGGIDVLFDPSNPQTVYAALWEARQAPWENGEFTGPGSGLYKSVDGGGTFRRIGEGLPTFEKDGLSRIGLAVAPSKPSRMFATVEAKRNAGLYRSDDAGETWARATDDARVAERADDFAEVKVHPLDPDVVFTASVVVWKSIDGGKTFSALRGAPGGDDYQRIWIDPKKPDVMLIASDQGAIVTVNGGETFSSWYNQSTAQMFHVAADNAFPYRVCGGQQESGSACVASRSQEGAITARDWHSAGIDEYAYAAPDPFDPDIIYGGRVARYDRRTGQAVEVGPVPLRGAGYRMVRTQPLVFSPTDPHTLYFASNTLWKTSSGGRAWTRISPDLTRKSWEPPANVGKYRGTPGAKPSQRGVIYTIAPSPVDGLTLWVGSDDGLIHVTRDGGKTWRDVTPPDLVPWAKVSLMDAGHTDALTAYAAINTLRLDDLRPYIYRTHDGGKTWTRITNGLPDGGVVDVVREDPKRKGLLFAGTEQAVYVSFDDGDRWQPLRLNMPATSIRDLIIKDDDLVVATHGRGFWILDDLTPLRQLVPQTLKEGVHLFEPQRAIRVRWSTNSDTPLPPDEPMGLNPPDGAIVDYYLKTAAPGPVALSIVDSAGNVVRSFASDEKAEPIRDEGNVPRYWVRPARILSAQAGLHRFVWDLHAAPPAVVDATYPMSAVPQDTPKEPRGPWVVPGRYLVKLTVGSETRTEPLVIAMDPRVKTPQKGLEQQFALSTRVAQALEQMAAALREVRKLREAPKGGAGGSSGNGGTSSRESLLAALESTKDDRPPGAPEDETPTLVRSNARLTHVFGLLQDADVAPMPQVARAADMAIAEARELIARLAKLRNTMASAP
jgi:photosystem II stability/assembly factor-like uncharacterized protein